MGEYYKIVTEEDHLEHYGVKGMKWDLKFRKHTDSWYKRMKQRAKGTAKDVAQGVNKAKTIYNQWRNDDTGDWVDPTREEYSRGEVGKVFRKNEYGKLHDKIANSINNASNKRKKLIKNVRNTGEKAASNVLKSIKKIKIPKLITEERTFR